MEGKNNRMNREEVERRSSKFTLAGTEQREMVMSQRGNVGKKEGWSERGKNFFTKQRSRLSSNQDHGINIDKLFLLYIQTHSVINKYAHTLSISSFGNRKQCIMS